ncbi:RNA polymerase sigma factor [Amycolatopsis sp. cmx-4-83]|uniref:RNA polymerase sigma factor n=1 Tax=Amycolatopsis sp. cmx-4-83 TaxID=2790940 RepID=UPI003979EDBB
MDENNEVERVLAEQEKDLLAWCSKRLKNQHDAEDLGQDTLLKAFENWSESGIPPNPQAWLRLVAQRLLIDGSRKAQRGMEFSAEDVELREIPRDEWLSTRLAMDGSQFLERVRAMLDQRSAKHFDLYLGKLVHDWSNDQIARKLGISAEATRGRLKRAGKAVAQRVEALCLIDYPGTGANHCSAPQAEYRRRGSQESPQLYAAVRTHIARCSRCSERRTKLGPLMGRILTIPVLMAPPKPVRAWLTKAVSAKTAAAVCATSVSLMLFFALKPVPELPPPAVAQELTHSSTEPPSTEPTPTGTMSAATSAPPSETTSGALPKETSASSAGASAGPAPVTTPAPATTANRGDRGPSVLTAKIDRRQVVVEQNHSGRDEKTWAEVDVVVDAEAASVEIGFSGNGRSFGQPLQGDPSGIAFTGRLGPFSDESFRGDYTLVIRVVARDRSVTTTRFGRFVVTSCRRSA